MSGGRPRRFFVPEVVQSSALDCGPASLKSLLEGHGIPIAYGRLREACQTDVDGTSLDALEEVAVELGLDAEQHMMPGDHIALDEAEALPAIVVVRLPNGVPHFVVVWRRHGRMFQVMDPGVGRRWLSIDELRAQLYIHETMVPVGAFDEWARSPSFLAPLRTRLAALRVCARQSERFAQTALAAPGWRALAALDAAVRATAELVESGAARRGASSEKLIASLAAADDELLDRFATARAGDDDDTVRLRGAVLLVARGKLPGAAVPRSPELAAARSAPRSRPFVELFGHAAASGALRPAPLLGALIVAAAVTTGEAVLWRSLIDLVRPLGVGLTREGALGMMALFLFAALAVDASVISGALWLGRQIETRLRVAFLHKIPRLGDRYFQSRLTSDMASRSHNVHRLRAVPALVASAVQSGARLALIVGGLIWIDRSQAAIAVIAGLLLAGLPLAALPMVRERDMRLYTHAGALFRFYMDALLGVIPLRAHNAAPAMRQGQEGLLAEWAAATRRLGSVLATLEAAQAAVGFTCAASLVIGHIAREGADGRVLLVAYWALELPTLGQALAQALRDLQRMTNVALGVVEPLGAPGEEPAAAGAPRAGAMGFRLENVSVRPSGHTILEGVDLDVEAGAHVAIAGTSGAGKSSLLALLLGLHQPAEGLVLVDGEPLQGAERQARVRSEIVWLDPAVHLWNRSLLENFAYGNGADGAGDVGALIAAADLHRLVARLPTGLRARLGEGGALVSGGEGQRVRLARALARRNARLALLDEPFRGLDRAQRRAQLAAVRQVFAGVTLLVVTHDLADTLDFPRVLVVDGGRIVEDGAPAELASRPGSRYAALLAAEEATRAARQAEGTWRRLRIVDGRLES